MRVHILVASLLVTSAVATAETPTQQPKEKQIVVDGVEFRTPEAPSSADTEAWAAWVSSMRTLYREANDELEAAMAEKMRKSGGRDHADAFEPNSMNRVNQARADVRVAQEKIGVLAGKWREGAKDGKRLGIPEDTFKGGIDLGIR